MSHINHIGAKKVMGGVPTPFLQAVQIEQAIGKLDDSITRQRMDPVREKHIHDALVKLTPSTVIPQRMSIRNFVSLQEPPHGNKSVELSTGNENVPSLHTQAASQPKKISAQNRIKEINTILNDAREMGLDERVLELLVTERSQLQDKIRDGAYATFKTQDLRITGAAARRLEHTLAVRANKKAKLKTDRQEARKAIKNRCDKFLKEFKSVIKNFGKLGKAIGDAAKGIREANVTGDSGRLAGFNSPGVDATLNDGIINADGLSGQLGTASSAMIGIAGVTQLVETAAEFYLFSNKLTKLQADERTVYEFAGSVAKLNETKQQLKLVNIRSDSAEKAIQMAREEGLDQAVIEVLEIQRDKILEETAPVREKLQSKIAELTEKVNNTAIGSQLAEIDRDKFYEDAGMEIAKLYKAGADGLKAIIDITRLAVATGTAAAEGLKAASGTVGAVVGPLTFVINTKDGVKDIQANRKALKLKHTTSDAIKNKAIRQDDAELLAIAERIRLKQKKQSVDKGLSATKNAFGALSGLASGFAAAATIAAMATSAAVGVAAIATPVGWALAGAAALAAIGYGCYKLARHLHSTAIKAALQDTLQILSKQQNPQATYGQIIEGLNEKETVRLNRVADKLLTSLQAQGINMTREELTVDDLQVYASKKLLARDTGVATSSLYHRFKDEVQAFFDPRSMDEISNADMEDYLARETREMEVGSAASLMAKLGLSLKVDDAMMLMKTGASGEGNALKFLSKKLQLV